MWTERCCVFSGGAGNEQGVCRFAAGVEYERYVVCSRDVSPVFVFHEQIDGKAGCAVPEIAPELYVFRQVTGIVREQVIEVFRYESGRISQHFGHGGVGVEDVPVD